MPEYQHRPDQGPMGDKNFLLFMVVAFLLVVLLSPLFLKNQPQQQPPAPAATPNQPAPQSSAPPAPATKNVNPPTPMATKRAESEAETVVENDLYKITFTNRGAQAKSWILKKYKDDKGNPLDLVNAQAAAQSGFPLSLWTYDEGLRKKLSDVLYVPDQALGGLNAASNRVAKNNSAPVIPAIAPRTLTYDYVDEDVTVHKTFKFDKSYVVKIETSVTHNGAMVQAYPTWPSALGDQTNATGYVTGRVNWQTPDGIQRQAAFEKNWFRSNTWVVGGSTIAGPFYWAGVTDQYFAAVFMPAQPQSSAMVTLHGAMEIPRDQANPKGEKDVVHVLGLGIGNPGGPTQVELFAGPKAVDVIGAIRTHSLNGAAADGPTLESVIDFGTFGWFAKMLFRGLNWTHDHLVSNWGWAIVVLTFIINLIFLPLRITQMKTSLKMQRVQPELQVINKKYEKYGFRDQEKMQQKQQETMALYRKAGVNPYGLSGCLPLLLQLPILYAFYAVLANTIELRQAHWLWIHDLSAPDPFHLLPIITVATMFIVQRATPMPGMDPAQRRMMNTMMPLTFGIFTWAVASGLALYWATSNVINVIQQWAMNQTPLGREIKELQLKRLRKKNK